MRRLRRLGRNFVDLADPDGDGWIGVVMTVVTIPIALVGALVLGTVYLTLAIGALLMVLDAIGIVDGFSF